MHAFTQQWQSVTTSALQAARSELAATAAAAHVQVQLSSSALVLNFCCDQVVSNAGKLTLPCADKCGNTQC
jgi:hypothetical protein